CQWFRGIFTAPNDRGMAFYPCCGASHINQKKAMKLETMALHTGYRSDPTTHAAAVPIYQTTSYTFDNTQHGADLFNLVVPGNIYTRIMNPTTAVLEARLAEMEGGVGALAMASGMAAINAASQCIARAGDSIVSTTQLYRSEERRVGKEVTDRRGRHR